jgi:hypothetical protein
LARNLGRRCGVQAAVVEYLVRGGTHERFELFEWSGMGRSIPVGRLTVDRLRNAVCTVLGNPAYRARAGRLRSSIEAADGLNRAADLIEGAFGSGPRALPSETGRTPELAPIALIASCRSFRDA